MKKLLYLTFVLGAIFLTASCERELVKYEPEAGEVGVSFLSDKAIVEMLPEDGNKISVDLYRGTTGTAVTVPVGVTDYDGIFAHTNLFDATTGAAIPVIDYNLYFIDGNYTALGFAETADGTPTPIPAKEIDNGLWIADGDGYLFVVGGDATTVVECRDEEAAFNFEAASAKATLTLSYPDINALAFGKDYTVEIYLLDDVVSPSGNDAVTVVASRKATRQDKGVGKWTSAVFGSWDQPIYNYAEATGIYTLPDLYTEKFDVRFSYDAGTITFPDFIDSMIMYDETIAAYGTYGFYPQSAVLSGGVITISCLVALPAIGYAFGVYPEKYTLPEGFSFE